LLLCYITTSPLYKPPLYKTYSSVQKAWMMQSQSGFIASSGTRRKSSRLNRSN